MLRDVALTTHICAGALGLAVGLFALRPPTLGDRRVALRRVYAVLLVVMVIGVIAAVAAGWSESGTTTRLVFAGLCVLGVFMLLRSYRSFRLARRRSGAWQGAYMNHVYFTYISLWEGFVIIAIVGSDLTAWLIPVSMVAVLVIGGFLINRYQRRVLPTPVAV